MQSSFIGSINEKGYLNGFTKRGYTFPKCILELVANVNDAFDKISETPAGFTRTLLFDITPGVIKFIDNACGMSKEGAGNMFSMHNENHASDSSRGVSGIGAKPALSILSKKTKVKLYTRTLNGEYLRITVPWNMIHISGKYTGMISVDEMTEEEKKDFWNDREENNMLLSSQAQGTTIEFAYNDELHGVITDNFENISTSNLKNPLDRIGCVFGRDSVKILYKHYEKREEVREIKLYDYFSENQDSYYKGFSEYTVEYMHSDRHDTDRFILHKDGRLYEIAKYGKGYKNDVLELEENTKGYRAIGKFIVRVGLKKDNAIFDINNPMRVTEDKLLIGGKKRVAYDREHLGEPGENSEFLSRNKLIRNGQLIGTISSEQAHGSSRADGVAFLKIELIQAYVYFNPVSSHENLQDKVMGIQENKNQFDGDSLPKNFTRLIRHLKSEKANEIIEYFQELTEPKDLQEESQETSSEEHVVDEVSSSEESSEEKSTDILSIISVIADSQKNLRNSGILEEFIVEKPAHVEEKPAPVEETPAHVEEKPAPVEETPAHVEETPAPVEETPAPVEETPAHVEETPAHVEETPAHVEETPAPVEETPAPVEETPAPVEETPAPVEQTPAPVEHNPVPIDVSSHRKGAVGGDELILIMQRVMRIISSEKKYSDTEHIKLFNLLNEICQGR